MGPNPDLCSIMRCSYRLLAKYLLFIVYMNSTCDLSFNGDGLSRSMCFRMWMHGDVPAAVEAYISGSLITVPVVASSDPGVVERVGLSFDTNCPTLLLTEGRMHDLDGPYHAYRYGRMLFLLHNAPAIFQRAKHSILLAVRRCS